MSATLTEPTEAHVPIGAQWWGLARDLRRRIAKEDDRFIATIQALIEPVGTRLRKYPKRSVRPELLVQLVQGWRFQDSRDFRIDLSATLERARCSVVERRAVAGQMKLAEWGDESEEPDIGITEVAVHVDGPKFRLGSQMICAFSLHAIARRLQRNPNGDLASLLYDMNLVALADRSKLSGGGFCVHTADGGWRGRVVRLQNRNGEPLPVLSIRTWLSE